MKNILKDKKREKFWHFYQYIKAKSGRDLKHMRLFEKTNSILQGCSKMV